jgi:hypothetical protein
MFDGVLALPWRVLTVARRVLTSTVDALEAVPRMAEAIDELRETLKVLERLTTFAAGELPEVVYQLEGIRAELGAIERRLAGEAALSPESPRTG